MAPPRPSALPQHAAGGLTDDALTTAPPMRSVGAYLREGVDRLAGADPGLTQLRTAVQAVLGIAVAVGLVYGFIKIAGGPQPSPNSPLGVSAYDHALLVVSMLLAGMVAMMAGFTVTDTTTRGQLISTAILPLPMLAALGLGLALGPYRVPSLVFLVVLLAAAVYVRRWGPRGFAAGLVAFNGGFLGFFLHTELALRDIGWLAADLAVGVIASLVVRFGVLRPDRGRTLDRMRHSWEARVRRLLELSTAALEDTAQQDGAAGRATFRERLQRQLVRLNESTLMIDAQLVEAVPGTAAIQAQRLFDAELALSNCARFAGALITLEAGPLLRAQARAALAAARDADWAAASVAVALLRATDGTARLRASDADENGAEVGADEGVRERRMLIACRLAASVEDYATARRELTAAIIERQDGSAAATYVPAVTLSAGFLPGSVPVSTAASTTPGRGGLLDRTALPPYLRASIQITVAATLAVILGDLVSGARLYWAVLATFLAFMATTNSGEQVRKALFRLAGTAFGIVVGDLLVHLTGGYIWTSLLIVLVALFFGIYLIRVNYTFMVIGITVTMSQLYEQLGEFSWHLLVLRLGETAIGVGSVVVTVLVIVPLRPQRVLTAGVLLWFRALAELLEVALDRLLGGDAGELRPAMRRLDAAFAAFEATARPLRRTTFGRNSEQLSEIQAISAAARNYARSLAVAVETAQAPDVAELHIAAQQLRSSLAAIDTRIETGGHGVFVRSAALVEMAAATMQDSSVRPALRDLSLVDGALARLATALQMDVRDHDVPVPA